MTIKEIAEFLNGELLGSGEIEILRVAALAHAGADEISFIEKPESAASTNAGCVIVSAGSGFDLTCPQIKVGNPKLAFARLAARLHPVVQRTGWHETALVAESSNVRASFIDAYVRVGECNEIGDGTQIFSGVRTGRNVSIGNNCIIYPNAVIYDNVSIGDGCVIHSGAVIGADGFGFVRDGANGYVKFPQIGNVIIENNCEIGAGTCIDRGALGETRIGEGSKIDNLVQIAHNVRIGKRVVIASQTGISGSTVIEDDCVIGGQVGMGDHATIKSGAVIGSQAGVLPHKIVRPGVWWGTPVQPLDEYKKQNAMVKGLARFRAEVRQLKKQLAEITASDKN